MHRNAWLSIVAVLIFGIACVSQPAWSQTENVQKENARVQRGFVGGWTLQSFEGFAEDGTVTTRSMSGSIMYSDNGRMAAQLMPDGYEKRPQPEEGAAADRSGYVAYFGRFEIDSELGSVTHHVEGSIIGPWVGRGLVRYYDLQGDTLELSLRDDTGRTTGTLTWTRDR